MKCKICNLNETDSTSGICWECMNKWYIIKIIKHKQKNPLSSWEARTCPRYAYLRMVGNNTKSNRKSQKKKEKK